ncbi:hypothetical protein FGO68_gene3050 [Halteria grandinella]|uniref:Uncharacterized protein n=1 Tax=Halteria grandinella TaxID=5974 RepID=A0A8J8NZK9_HALGN|nr:hypothetical protein FGO68_gene3050 [Halteria grandinella]
MLKTQKEIEEIDKLNSNQECIHRMVQSGLCTNGQVPDQAQLLGVLHTKIILDAEQDLSENVIKVNSIDRQFTSLQRSKADQANLAMLADLQKVSQFNQAHRNVNSRSTERQPQHICGKLNKQFLKQENPPHQNEDRQSVMSKKRVSVSRDNSASAQPPGSEFTPSELAYLNKELSTNQRYSKQTGHQVIPNPNDPFALHQMHLNIKKDQDSFLTNLNYHNYVPHNSNLCSRPRVISKLQQETQNSSAQQQSYYLPISSQAYEQQQMTNAEVFASHDPQSIFEQTLVKDEKAVIDPMLSMQQEGDHNMQSSLSFPDAPDELLQKSKIKRQTDSPHQIQSSMYSRSNSVKDEDDEEDECSDEDSDDEDEDDDSIISSDDEDDLIEGDDNEPGIKRESRQFKRKANGIFKQKTIDLRKRRCGSDSRKRSKYKMLNPEIKRQAVNLVRELPKKQ